MILRGPSNINSVPHGTHKPKAVMMATQTQSPPDVNLLAGPSLLGAFLAWGLQGVLTLQCYLYYTWFPKDRRLLKLLVWGTFIWEWVQMGLITQNYFEAFVYHYGELSSLTSYNNSWFSAPVMTGVVSFAVQCFFAWRIWMLSHSLLLTVAVLFLSLAQMGLGIAGGVVLHISQADAVEASRNRIIISAGLIAAAVVDVIIAGSMTYLLLRLKSGIKQSDAMVHKIVRFGIETGTATAAVALLYAILYMYRTKDLLFECPAMVLTKLYSNTFLASLNNRALVAQPTDLTQSILAASGGFRMPTNTSGRSSTTILDDGAGDGSFGMRTEMRRETDRFHPTPDASKDVGLVPLGCDEPSTSV